MLNSNDSAAVVKHVANDLIKHEKQDIVGSMSRDAKIDFVNGVRTLNEVCDAIEKEIVADNNLLLIHTG